jgi:hypothetical protein
MARSKDNAGAHLSLCSSTIGRAEHDCAARELGVTPHLNADDIAELGAAIERSLCEGELHESGRAEIDVDLRRALRVACAKARLQRVRAEQLLIDLKQVWVAIPAMLSTRTEERLNQIVSACIDEYYSGEKSPSS